MFNSDEVTLAALAGALTGPITNRCVEGAAGYTDCPNLKGTHLDHTLDVKERVAAVVSTADLDEVLAAISFGRAAWPVASSRSVYTT